MSLANNVYTTQAGTVYLKRAGTFDPFIWGGGRMRVDEGSDELGGVTTTTKQSAAGGIERDSVLQEAQGPASIQVVMKHEAGNRMKTELKKCWWHVDRRTSCAGRDRDDPFGWEEITRFAWQKAGSRSTPASTWESEEEALINVPFNGLDSFDIYRVNGEEVDPGDAAHVLAVSVCRPEQCPSCDDSNRECIVVASTSLVAAASPILYVNTNGGDPDSWTSISLTEWTTGDADDVLCMGNLTIVVSTTEAEILRSNNRGTTRQQVSISDFAANPPTCIDGIDQSFIVMGGQNGYVYGSYDGGRTWDVLTGGGVTTENINEIMIDRNNPNVVYAVGANNAIIKTENAGVTWQALTGPSPSDALLTIWVEDVQNLIVVNDDNEIWETTDGGASWSQQTALDFATSPVTLTNAAIVRIDHDVYYLTATDGTESAIFRNVDGGASGYWEALDQSPSGPPLDVAACDSNRAVIVGGETTNGLITLYN